VRCLPASCLACAAILATVVVGGCGEGGVESGATVSVYVAAPLCKEAREQLQRQASTVEDLHIRANCLPTAEPRGSLDLSQIGANARRATEDSTTIAYLEAPGPGARFSRTIVESADIGWTTSSSGSTAMRRVLHALVGNASSPRATVREALEEVG
jgi:hypothetical protein